jgi:hypothetical protein
MILLDARAHDESDTPRDPAANGIAHRASDVQAMLDDLNILPKVDQ